MSAGDTYIPRGWMCPKCGQVWAPHVDRCYCRKGGAEIPWGGPFYPQPVQPDWQIVQVPAIRPFDQTFPGMPGRVTCDSVN